MRSVLVVIGTRPEAVKLAPVVRALADNGEPLRVQVALSGQHAHMVRPVLDLFGIEPDADLAIMTHGQSLCQITARALTALDHLLDEMAPDLVLVQGDTTTVLSGALAAFYKKIPVGHVEAGLRTGDLWQPFPEEMNRRATGIVTNLHFAPTMRAKEALLAEGIPQDGIYVTGNTVTDALRLVMAKEPEAPHVCLLGVDESLPVNCLTGGREYILMEVHRRESIPDGIRAACRVVRTTARERRWAALVSVHPNPAVRAIVVEELANVPEVSLLEPTDYQVFVPLAAAARLIVTDSGGLQEEAPSFGVPVVVARNRTERPEGVAGGVTFLGGLTEDSLLAAVAAALEKPFVRPEPGETFLSPYGDGRCSERIVRAILHFFGLGARPEDYEHG